MLERAVDISRSVVQWLWPPHCVLCGQPGQQSRDLCAGCEADLLLNDNVCEHCAEPLPRALSLPTLCGACLHYPPTFDACVAPFLYAFPVDRMIQGLKYRRELHYGRVLGELLAGHLSQR